MDELELEQTMKLPHSFDEVREDHFPLFLTVRRLLYMVDASLVRPFFVRNAQREIVGLDANAEWHNEAKGVMMINHYHKEGARDLNKRLKEGKVDLESSDEEQVDENQNEHEIAEEEMVDREIQKR